MSQTTEELRNELHKSLGLLRMLREEVRVSLHLTGMDARTQWSRLEPRLADVQRAARAASAASRAAVTDAGAPLKALRESLP